MSINNLLPPPPVDKEGNPIPCKVVADQDCIGLDRCLVLSALLRETIIKDIDIRGLDMKPLVGVYVKQIECAMGQKRTPPSQN